MTDFDNWQKVKQILNGALERSPQTRDKFVESACAGDLSLLGEVKSLLVFENEEADFIGKSAFDFFDCDLPETARAELFVGKKIGNYEIERKLGAGGMGTVFLARRAGGEFEQTVAVKIIKRGIGTEAGALRRFFLERRILAQLEHPNIARLIDGGTTTDESLPYFVMEYVEGVPLTEYARERNLSLDERLHLFREICAAVGYAHRQLIVHRDLKPSNILVNKDGVPKLLDFGIAKITKDESVGETRTHLAAFTPEYASPEQMRGEKLSTATDVYSLGVILYELLTGARPFNFDGKNIGEIIATVSRIEPSAPSRINAECGMRSAELKTENQKPNPQPKMLISHSKDLDNIVLKALKKDAARRYLSVEQFCEDISRFQSGFPVSARPDTFSYRAEKFIARNPLVFAASVVAFVALVTGIIAVAHQARIANTERARAERRFNDVRRLADSFVFEINEEIEKSPIKARELMVVRAIEYLDKLAQEADGDVSLQSDLAAAYEKIGDVQSEIFHPAAGDSRGALESHTKALRIREALAARDEKNVEKNLDVVKSYAKIGDISAMTGDTASALKNYNLAIALDEKHLETEPKNAALRQQQSRNYAKLGQAVLRSGSISEALKNYEKAVEIQKDLVTENPSDAERQLYLAAFYEYVGYAKMEMGAGEDALQFFKDELAVEEKLFDADKNNVRLQSRISGSEFWIAYALRNLGRNAESLDWQKKGLKIQETIFNGDTANYGERNALGDCYLEIGKTLLNLKRFGEATGYLNQAIAHYRAVAERDAQNLSARRQVFYTRVRLAAALAGRGEFARASENYEQSLEAFRELTSADPRNTEYESDLAFAHLSFGEVHLKKGDRAKARAHFDAALPVYERIIAASPENARWREELKTLKTRIGESES